MNADEAKFLLSALREDDCTSADPLPGDIAAAYELMQGDPELNRWFKANCAFDQAVAEQCAQQSTPSDLETSILAGIRVSTAVPWWRHRATLAFAAAAVIAVFAVASWWQSHQSPATDAGLAKESATNPGDHLEFRQAMISEIESLIQFDFASHDPQKIDQWIAAAGSPTPAVVDTPAKIGGASVAGCKLLNWNGHRATLICFLGENAAGEPIAFHLVAIDRKAFGDLPVAGPASIVAHEDSDWTSSIEIANDQSQVLFIGTKTGADISDIRQLL